jgi:uncharacterized membrane protein YhiD involved in acid resistance
MPSPTRGDRRATVHGIARVARIATSRQIRRGLPKQPWYLGRAIGLAVLVALPHHGVMAQAADSLRTSDQTTEPTTGPAAQSTQSIARLLQDESSGGRRHAAREAVAALAGSSIRPGMTGLTWRPQAMMATLIALSGALLLALPMLAVYRLTTPAGRFDPALAESLLILPVAVAGIVTVIQGSLAVALGLAGVVTTVRFRSALRETNDAAYIFLAVAIGVAAGASALDIGAVLALFFCAALILLWATRRYVARKYPEAVAPPLWMNTHGKHEHGAGAVSGTTAPDAVGPAGEDHHAVITVHAQQKEAAQRIVEPLLGERTKSWALEHTATEPDGSTALTYSVHLRRHVTPQALASAIHEAGAHDGIAVRLGAESEMPLVPPVPAAGPDGPAGADASRAGSKD